MFFRMYPVIKRKNTTKPHKYTHLLVDLFEPKVFISKFIIPKYNLGYKSIMMTVPST